MNIELPPAKRGGAPDPKRDPLEGALPNRVPVVDGALPPKRLVPKLRFEFPKMLPPDVVEAAPALNVVSPKRLLEPKTDPLVP